MSFEPVTPNVFTDVTIRGCNPSYVVTSHGTVVVDTPQMPSKAVSMRKEAESKGAIQYVINTEHHVDHIFGNYFFKGAGTVIHHQGLAGGGAADEIAGLGQLRVIEAFEDHTRRARGARPRALTGQLVSTWVPRIP